MNKDLLVIEKNYEQVCSQWLGLKPAKKRALIVRQLGKRLEALRACRLLRECRIAERARGQGFKLVAFAGTGFFSDYENIYRRRLQAPSPIPHEPEPLVYLHEFHKQLGHDRQEFAPKEVTYVRELLERYGDEGVRSLMTYGLSEGREASFHNMQWFGVLSIYEGEWKA
jgi:hypothetical protein